MRFATWFVLPSLLCVSLLAADTKPQPAIHFPVRGFSIAPLEAPGPTKGMLLAMLLPPIDGFAPNVNVVSQNSPGTIGEYIDVTKRAMKNNNMKVIRADRLNETTAIFEYVGKIGEKPAHWFAKANRKGDDIILVTATATEAQWTTLAKQLQDCVNSFQRDPAK